MGVPPGKQGRPCRRADGRRVKAIIAQPIARKPVERGRLRRAAEGRGGSKADIVEQHQDDIGRALGSLSHIFRGRGHG